jgi:hypothetical protein
MSQRLLSQKCGGQRLDRASRTIAVESLAWGPSESATLDREPLPGRVKCPEETVTMKRERR